MPRLSQEQKEARRLGLGASDIGEMLAISPYEGASPVRLFAEKAGLLTFPDDEDETSERAVGHALEGALAHLYEVASGRKCTLSGEYVESVVHPDIPWARCNLDGRIDGMRAGLEIKCVGIGMADHWDLSSDDGIPHYVRVQVAWQMFVADLDQVHVVALVGGPSGFRVFYVHRDPELEAMLVKEATSFWANVQAKKAPDLDAGHWCRVYLEKLYPTPPDDVEVEADEELAELLEERIRAAAAEKRAEEAKEIRNNQIREAMGKRGATVVYSKTARAIWRESKDGKRPLLVKAIGAAKKPRIVQKANAARLPAIDDGDVF